MSVEYPIIVKEGKVYFSSRLDHKRGSTIRTVGNLSELYRPYGMVVPCSSNGLFATDYIEQATRNIAEIYLTTKVVVIDSQGVVREVTFTSLDGENIELVMVIPTEGVAVIGGSDVIASQCGVMFGVEQDPMTVLKHVGRVNGDRNSHFFVVDIAETALALNEQGYTATIYDYLATSTALHKQKMKKISEMEIPYLKTTEQVIQSVDIPKDKGG